MSVTRYRWLLLALSLQVCLSVQARADDTIFGTTGVSFQRVQSEGVLHGCSLVYQAVAADHAYREGKAVVIVGNVTVQIESRTVMLVLKIGISDDIETGMASFQAPQFAYLQTKTATTSQAKHAGGEVSGFRLFAVRLDESATKLLGEMLGAREVTIGFNRKKGGLDLLVPIDFTVADVQMSGDKVVRKRSNESTDAFAQCVLSLMDQALKDTQK